MRRWLPTAALAALTGAAIWGSAMGVFQLRQAVSESQELYRLDIIGSQIESDLEFQIQQSRFARPGALSSAQNSSHQADENVRGTLQHLRQLAPPGTVNQSIEEFEAAWSAYSQTHENNAFLAAQGKLHALKHAIESHARRQASRLDRTLTQCLRDLAAFVTATFMILAALMKIRRARGGARFSPPTRNSNTHKRWTSVAWRFWRWW